MKIALAFCDDDDVQVMAFKTILKQLYPHASIETFQRGKACIEWLAQIELPPDLIVLDINMPGGLDGVDVLRWIRKQSRFYATPVVMFTTGGSDIQKDECMDAGATEYVQKPPVTVWGMEIKRLVKRHVEDRQVVDPEDDSWGRLRDGF